jgi:hypothetical protein
LFLVNVYRREGLQQILGNGDGQGFYNYKTFHGFKKYKLNNPAHILFHTYRNPRMVIKVYECLEGNEYRDESEMKLVYTNGPQN